MNLTSDRVEFAAARKTVLDDAEQQLHSVVVAALEHWGQASWFAPILATAEEIFRTAYRSEADESPDDGAADQLLKDLAKTLRLTGEPTDQTASLIERWIATAAVNYGTAAAAEDDAEDLVLEWVTMHDSHVRESHAQADGQTRRSGAPFHVGESEMEAPGDPTAPIEEWINCRCVLRPDLASNAASLQPEHDEGVTMTAAVTDTEAPTELPLPDPVPWYGVLAPEGTQSGDGRSFKANSLRNRDLPLPLTWQRQSEPGHDGSIQVARIDGIHRDATGMMQGHGVFLQSVPEADQVVGMMAEMGRMGISVDIDDATFDVDEDAQQVEFSDARICSASLVTIPAFQEAYIVLGTAPWLTDQTDDQTAESDLAASVETMKRGPGWVTDPEDTRRIHSYWTTPGQPGYEKIAWGTGGDFNRCRVEVGKYLADSGEARFINQTCAQWHHDALGIWPATHAKEIKGHAAEAVSMVAAGGLLPPDEWFANPEFESIQPLRIVRDEATGLRRVFGYIAQWGVCHIGFPNACVTAPESQADYAYFKTGAVLTASGAEIPVGNITLGGGHASPGPNVRQALAHYDSTSTVVADVNVGEDNFGIWAAGWMRPSASEDDEIALRAAALSGDWRRINGAMELIATLAVNTPGFMIPRPQVAVQDGLQVALVAAGVVQQSPTLAVELEFVTDAVIAEIEARQARKARLAAVTVKVQGSLDDRLATLSSRGE